MRSGWFQTAKVLALVLGLWGADARVVHAEAFNFSEDINKFGLQDNFIGCVATGGACAAVSSINSFIFLENQYPGIYDNTLTPNGVDAKKTDFNDAFNFAEQTSAVSMGIPWTGGGGTRLGYYTRFLPPPTGIGATDPNQTFLNTKEDWINDHAPGTTTFSSMWNGKNGYPTTAFLANQIKTGEDVEFFVKDEGFYHALTLTGIACDALGNCNITYLDPNEPTKLDGTPLTFNPAITPDAANGNRLEFTGVPGSGFDGTVFIDAAFAESPIPEPSSLLLLGTGIAGLILVARKMRYKVS